MPQSSTLCQSGISCHDFAYLDTEVQERTISLETECPVARGFITRLTSKKASSPSTRKTYLLSGSSLQILEGGFVRNTLRTLLSNPHTGVFLLVPANYIVHPTVLNFSKLPKSAGSCLQVVPFDDSISDYDEKVCHCLTKYGKCKGVDAFMAFEEDCESRVKLSAIAKRLNDNKL